MDKGIVDNNTKIIPCNHKIELTINCYNGFVVVRKYCIFCKKEVEVYYIYKESIIESEEYISTEDSIL